MTARSKMSAFRFKRAHLQHYGGTASEQTKLSPVEPLIKGPKLTGSFSSLILEGGFGIPSVADV